MSTTSITAGTPVTVDRAPDGAYVLHAITPTGVVSLGSHRQVADAWRAIDELDAPVGLARAA